MEGEAWFILLLTAVIIPAGFAALWARGHPEGARSVRAWFLSWIGPGGRAWAIYARTFRDVLGLGAWALLPAGIVLASLTWKVILAAAAADYHYTFYYRFYNTLAIHRFGAGWGAIGLLFWSGDRMDSAFSSPISSFGGMVLFWALLVSCGVAVYRGRGVIRGAESWGGLLVAGVALLLLTFVCAFDGAVSLFPGPAWTGRYAPLSGLYAAALLVAYLGLFPVSYVLGVQCFRWKTRGEAWDVGTIAKKYADSLLPFALLLWILDLPWLARYFSFYSSSEAVGAFVAGPAYIVADWAITLLGIALIPLFVAMVSFGWDLESVWRKAWPLYRDRGSALLAAIPLFWVPFLLIELALWLAGFVIDVRDSRTYWIGVALGVGAKVVCPVLSLFPLIYFYRVVGEEEGSRAAEPVPETAAPPSAS